MFKRIILQSIEIPWTQFTKRDYVNQGQELGIGE